MIQIKERARLLLLVIVYTHSGNAALGTAPLTADVCAFVLPFAALMLLLKEARKALVRRRPTR